MQDRNKGAAKIDPREAPSGVLELVKLTQALGWEFEGDGVNILTGTRSVRLSPDHLWRLKIHQGNNEEMLEIMGEAGTPSKNKIGRRSGSGKPNSLPKRIR